MLILVTNINVFSLNLRTAQKEVPPTRWAVNHQELKHKTHVDLSIGYQVPKCNLMEYCVMTSFLFWASQVHIKD